MGCATRELSAHVQRRKSCSELGIRHLLLAVCVPALRQRSLWDHIPPYFARQYSRGSVPPLLQAGKMLSKYLGTARGTDILGNENKEGGHERGDLQGAGTEWWPQSPTQLCFLNKQPHSLAWAHQQCVQLQDTGSAPSSREEQQHKGQERFHILSVRYPNTELK